MTAKKGDRVELLHTNDPHTKLRPGDQGTVSVIDDAGTVHVAWDSGSGLGLLPGIDRFRVVSDGSNSLS